MVLMETLIRKKISVIPDKNGKSASTQLAPPVPGHAYGLRYVKHFVKFPDFFEKHNVVNLAIYYYKTAIVTCYICLRVRYPLYCKIREHNFKHEIIISFTAIAQVTNI